MAVFKGNMVYLMFLRLLKLLRSRRCIVKMIIVLATCLTLKPILHVYVWPDSLYSIDTKRLLDGEEIRFVEFDESRPKKVVLMSYQRSGSSFIGELFNRNPGVSYVYEPLDAVYAGLYGVPEAQTSTGNIYMLADGSDRYFPLRELRGVTELLDDLLSCRMTSLPTEFLVHYYWYHFRKFQGKFTDYGECLEKEHISRKPCTTHLPIMCNKPFYELTEVDLDRCSDWMNGHSKEALPGVNNTTSSIGKYHQCMESMRGLVIDRCIDHLTKHCEDGGPRIRATKTVRATMGSAFELVKKDPGNTRIIHLIRDPRGAAKSRAWTREVSLKSSYGWRDEGREAELYCRGVVRDVQMRRHLETSYPKSVLTVVYDEFVLRPLEHVEQIYAFLKEDLPHSTRDWILNNTNRQGLKHTKLMFPNKRAEKGCAEFRGEFPDRFLNW